MTPKHNTNVVTMGGGTGTFPIISALKNMPVNIASIIAVSDSGGSTGRIRDEFGFQPVGDLRQTLAALAKDHNQDWIRDILLYRFAKGTGLKGHNLGNLILTALQDMTGSTSEALEIACRIFRLQGKVIPVTQDTVDLELHFEDGTQMVGEHLLDDDTKITQKITHVSLTPPTQINPTAAETITAADYILIGPGDYYASLMATLVAEGTQEAFSQSKAKIIYLVNLMTRFTQTNGMTASDHVTGIETTIGKKIDTIIINNEPIPEPVLARYAASKEYPVENDLLDDPRVKLAPLISDEVHQKGYQDNTHRSLLRHDTQKLQKVLSEIITAS